jgi:hypothetical protein
MCEGCRLIDSFRDALEDASVVWQAQQPELTADLHAIVVFAGMARFVGQYIVEQSARMGLDHEEMLYRFGYGVVEALQPTDTCGRFNEANGIC